MADHQTQIRLCSATTIQQETEYIWKEAVKAPKIGKTSAILVPTQQAAINFVNRVLSYEKKLHGHLYQMNTEKLILGL
jgi:hypothetical protein